MHHEMNQDIYASHGSKPSTKKLTISENQTMASIKSVAKLNPTPLRGIGKETILEQAFCAKRKQRKRLK